MKPPLKILDTFAGIGGFSYAAEKIIGGFETTQFIEIEPYCQKVLKKHWPNVPIHDDIKTFTARPFQFDVITGGFPCQDISVAGLQKGITKQSRSGLFYELVRVICLVRPKFIVLENVAAILNNGLDIVLGELSEAGYDAEWSVISASSLGACHRRSRWWLVAYPKSIGCGGRNSERCSIQERQLFSGKQRGSEMGSKTQRCSDTTSNPNSNGHQGRFTETRNKVTSGQDSQIIRSTNTSELKRCSDDGEDKEKSPTYGNLSKSSDGGKTISTNTGRIRDLSQKSNNNQGISSQNNYQENNNRTLVSEGQEGIQLSLNRELVRDQTISEDNKIRHEDDNSENKRMDNKKSNITNSDSKRLQGRVMEVMYELQETRDFRKTDSCSGKELANPNNNGLSSTEKRGINEKTSNRTSQREKTVSQSKGGSEPTGSGSFQSVSNTTDTFGSRTQSNRTEKFKSIWTNAFFNSKERRTLSPDWTGYVSEPCLRRGDDGLRGRTHRLRALGNSIVPTVAAIPLQRVHDLYYK